MEQRSKNILTVLILVAIIAILSFVLYQKFLVLRPKTIQPPPVLNVPTKILFPTKTPAEVKIISQIITLEVNITDKELFPPILNIKQFDQVKFINNSSKTIKVKGDNWGNVSLFNGENMTQEFKDQGTFSYDVSGLNLSGQIVVK